MILMDTVDRYLTGSDVILIFDASHLRTIWDYIQNTLYFL